MTRPLDFPIPFPSQLPSDDLANARMMLEAVTSAMENYKGLSPSEAHNLFVIICSAVKKLEAISLFLEALDCPDLQTQYQNARRLWVMQNGGAS